MTAKRRAHESTPCSQRPYMKTQRVHIDIVNHAKRNSSPTRCWLQWPRGRRMTSVRLTSPMQSSRSARHSEPCGSNGDTQHSKARPPTAIHPGHPPTSPPAVSKPKTTTRKEGAKPSERQSQRIDILSLYLILLSYRSRGGQQLGIYWGFTRTVNPAAMIVMTMMDGSLENCCAHVQRL